MFHSRLYPNTRKLLEEEVNVGTLVLSSLHMAAPALPRWAMPLEQPLCTAPQGQNAVLRALE